MSRSYRFAFALLGLGPGAFLACTGSDPVPFAGEGEAPDATVIGPDATTDGARSDAGGGEDAGTQPDAAPANLLLEADFEATTCGTSWAAFQASKTAGPARNGAQGCQVCFDENATVYIFGVAQGINVIDLVPGQTYTATVHARRPIQPTPTATDLRLEITLNDGDGQAIPGADNRAEYVMRTPPSNGAWAPLAVDYTYRPTDGGATVAFNIINRPGVASCFVVDDASFVSKP